MSARLQWILIWSWVAAGLFLALFTKVIDDAIWILLGGVELVYLLVGLVLFVVLLTSNARTLRQGWRRVVALPLAAIAVWFASGRLALLGDEAQFFLRFRAHEADYIRLSQLAQLEQQMPQAGDGDIPYELDGASPTRVAFPLPGGILDNWEAVIFDPTDQVATAKGWGRQPGDFTASPAAKKLFGGDLLACRHVKGHFYRCWFT